MTKQISIRLWNNWKKKGKLVQRCQLINLQIYPCIIRLQSGLYVAGDIQYRAGQQAIVNTWCPTIQEFVK